jgi:hypothetical protein
METIEKLYRKHGTYKIAVDYLKARSLAIEIMVTKGGWNSLTTPEKNYIIAFYAEDPAMDLATNNQVKGQFLVMNGVDPASIAKYLRNAYSKHHIKENEACKKRADSIAATDVVAKYLTLVDARDFIELTKTLYDLFKDQGIKGLNYGSVGEALMDFINSTVGTSFETTGLEQQGYTLNTGTWVGFREELIDILINGNYKR